MWDQWQIDIWRSADVASRMQLLTLDEIEPTYVAGCAMADPLWVGDLCKDEADEIIGLALCQATHQIRATITSVTETRTSYIHAFSVPSHLGDTGGLQQRGDISIAPHGQITGFVHHGGTARNPVLDIEHMKVAELLAQSTKLGIQLWDPVRHLTDLTPKYPE